MNIAARFFKSVFGIYAILIFIIVLIITSTSYTILFLVADKKKAPFIAHKWISRPWARTLFIFYGIRLAVKNKELLDKDQTYVFIGNHRSLLDIPAYALSMKHVIRFLAKVELTKIPLFGYVINKLYISVDRKDKVARARSMDNMMQSLNEGISVFLCPEGTRNKTDQPFLQFHDGAFRLAIQTQLPIAMLVLKNSDRLLSPKHLIELRPGLIKGSWCEPIITKGMTQDDLPRLKEETIARMTAMFSSI